MRIEHLKYLLEIERCRSISRAAKRLYVTQPTLSAVLTGIEKELGFRIFKRTNQGVIPTANGAAMLEESLAILNYYNGWQADSEKDEDLTGDVLVAASPGVCSHLMGDVIMQMQGRFPKVDYTVLKLQKTQLLREMETKQVNIGLTSLIKTEVPEFMELAARNNWHADLIMNDRSVGIISTKNPRAQQALLTAEDLADMTFVTYISLDNDRMTQMINSVLPESCRRIMVNSDTTIWQLVARDLGVSTAPLSSARENYYMSSGSVKYIELENYVNFMDIYIIYPGYEGLSRAERRFIESVKDYFAAM